jgi:hypothetical protein
MGYWRRRLGTIDSYEAAVRWSLNDYYDVWYSLFWRLISFPFNEDRFLDILLNDYRWKYVWNLAARSQEPEWAEHLVEAMRSENTRIKCGAILLLALFQPGPEVIPEIEAATHHDNFAVADSAQWTLERLRSGEKPGGWPPFWIPKEGTD